MLKDADIREPLFEFLDEYYGKNRIIEEKSMGRSRADIVMVLDGALVGIEIKSDADTYVRLERQIKDYDLYFDYNLVVVGSSHGMHIKEHVPEHWGIITVEEVEGKSDFYYMRQPATNPKLKMEKKLSILWRMELVELQEKNAMPKYKDKSKDFVVKAILERTQYPEDKKGYIPFDSLQQQISDILFERDYSTVTDRIMAYKQAQNPNKKFRRKRKRARKRLKR